MTNQQYREKLEKELDERVDIFNKAKQEMYDTFDLAAEQTKGAAYRMSIIGMQEASLRWRSFNDKINDENLDLNTDFKE